MGFMYFGAYKALHDSFPKLYNMTLSEFLSTIEGFAGTSIGALMSLILMLNLGPERVDELVTPHMACMRSIVPLPDITMLLSRYGLDNGDALRKMITTCLRAGGICDTATFEDVRRLLKCRYVCVATNLSTREPFYFSADTTPHMAIADAIFMSMCVPFVWTPLKYNDTYFVDGCLSNSVPDIFQRSETLYFGFDLPQECLRIENLNDYIMAVFKMTVDARTWHHDECCLLCQMPRSMPTDSLDFDIAPAMTAMRVRCGYASILTLLYPQFMPTIVSALEMTYQVVLEQQAQMWELDG